VLHSLARCRMWHGHLSRYSASLMIQWSAIESLWRRDLPHPSRPTLGPTHPSIQWVTCLFPGGKAAGAWLKSPTSTSPLSHHGLFSSEFHIYAIVLSTNSTQYSPPELIQSRWITHKTSATGHCFWRFVTLFFAHRFCLVWGVERFEILLVALMKVRDFWCTTSYRFVTRHVAEDWNLQGGKGFN
jgi:hypothetical protein